MAKNAAKSPGWNNNIGLLDHSLPPLFTKAGNLLSLKRSSFLSPAFPFPRTHPPKPVNLSYTFPFAAVLFFFSHILPRPGPDDFPSRAPAPRCCPVFSDDLPSSQGQNSHPYPRSHCNLFYILRPIRTQPIHFPTALISYSPMLTPMPYSLLFVNPYTF